MALESGQYISQLVSTNPSGGDIISQGDDHLRLIKSVLKTSFPDVDQSVATVVSKSSAPTTQVKGTIWYDTVNEILKINTADTGQAPVWVDIANLAGADTSVAFFAHMNGVDQNVADRTHTVIAFSTEDYDEGNCFDVTNNWFIAPSDGIYNFHASSYWTNIALVDHVTRFIKNGSAGLTPGDATVVAGRQYFTSYDGGANTGNISLQISATLKLLQGDTIRVQVQTESGNLTINGSPTESYFCGFKI